MHYEEVPVPQPEVVKAPELIKMYEEVAKWMKVAGVNPLGNIDTQLQSVRPEHQATMPKPSEIQAYVYSVIAKNITTA